MLTRNLLWRIAGPTLFVSLLFLVSCSLAAVYLHLWKSGSSRVLDEDIRGRRLTGSLLIALEGELIPAEGEPAGSRERLRHIRELMDRVRDAAGGGDEARLVRRLGAGVDRYLRRLAEPGPDGDPSGARAILEAEVLPAGHALERFYASEVERFEKALARTMTRMVWGLIGLGVVGSLTGLLLAHGVARGLCRAVLRAEELAEVGQVAAGMAHELRNPLTSIKMLVQINREKMEESGLPSDDLYAIEQEIRRMENRLNVFMDFARPARPERRRLDLVAVVEETLSLVGGRARKQRVALHFERPGAPIMAEVDGEQIRQLLVNLALNALDVMPRGGILEIELGPPVDGQVELHVLDTGPGIEPQNLPRLYEPFFTSKEMGLGLGLAISQRIARDHGGSLRARNQPEGGACFVLRLPVADDPRP